MAAQTLFEAWVQAHPSKAAKAALKMLTAPTDLERDRGHKFALALRDADRCAVCGRKLENDDSKAIGIGPDCLADHPDEAAQAIEVMRAAGILPAATPDAPALAAADAADDGGTPLTVAPPTARRTSKRAEGRQWDEINNDGTPNVGSYAVLAAAGMVELAVELLAAAGRPLTVELVRWAAGRLLEATDAIQAAVRADGRSDRMVNSHARARGALRTAITHCPFPAASASADGTVPAGQVDVVHRWHADAVAIGANLLTVAVEISGTDWRAA
jgi:hypothetical protein